MKRAVLEEMLSHSTVWEVFQLTKAPRPGENVMDMHLVVGTAIMQIEQSGWKLHQVYTVAVPVAAMDGQSFVTHVYGLFRKGKG